MTTTTRRRFAATATALTLAATLAACSQAAEPTAEPAPAQRSATAEETDETDAGGQYNDADTRFAQMMIIHHEGALGMAELAIERGSTEEVRALGERIAAAQGPEIELMSGWLEGWGQDLPTEAEHAGMDHGGMDMEGMNQEQVMKSLSQLDGVEFDRRFLELMVAHHRGAIEMAEAHRAEGQYPEARQLAGKIIDDQTREITEMENILQGL